MRTAMLRHFVPPAVLSVIALSVAVAPLPAWAPAVASAVAFAAWAVTLWLALRTADATDGREQCGRPFGKAD